MPYSLLSTSENPTVYGVVVMKMMTLLPMTVLAVSLTGTIFVTVDVKTPTVTVYCTVVIKFKTLLPMTVVVV